MSFMPLAIAAKVLPMVFVEPLRFEIDLTIPAVAGMAAGILERSLWLNS
jgi:hypothetical protein